MHLVADVYIRLVARPHVMIELSRAALVLSPVLIRDGAMIQDFSAVSGGMFCLHPAAWMINAERDIAGMGHEIRDIFEILNRLRVFDQSRFFFFNWLSFVLE